METPPRSSGAARTFKETHEADVNAVYLSYISHVLAFELWVISLSRLVYRR